MRCTHFQRLDGTVPELQTVTQTLQRLSVTLDQHVKFGCKRLSSSEHTLEQSFPENVKLTVTDPVGSNPHFLNSTPSTKLQISATFVLIPLSAALPANLLRECWKVAVERLRHNIVDEG